MKCTRRARRGLAGLVIGILGLALAGCTLPLSTPGATAKIALVSTATVDDWRYDFYRNWDCPCSISGYQTFTVGTKVGSADTKLDNEPDKLVTRGVLTVPLMHIWNISDPQSCGSPPMSCPRRGRATNTS